MGTQNSHTLDIWIRGYSVYTEDIQTMSRFIFSPRAGRAIQLYE